MSVGNKFCQIFKRVFFTWAGKCSCVYRTVAVAVVVQSGVTHSTYCHECNKEQCVWSEAGTSSQFSIETIQCFVRGHMHVVIYGTANLCKDMISKVTGTSCGLDKRGSNPNYRPVG